MIITVEINEKEIINAILQQKQSPKQETKIKYNELDITRKYYKKGDPEYHRKPIKKALKTLKFDRIVKQEPLLEIQNL